MSQLYVDNIRNRTGGPIGIPTGAVVTGVVTATTGNITGNLTVGGNADITGVLTYEDVTNVDSVGVVTARSGIEFGASGVGGTITATGQAEFAGVCTASSFSGSFDGSTASFSGNVSIADSIFHTGDTDTSIRFPAADTFTVETSGSERLRVTSAGDVGIGTDIPSSYDSGGRTLVLDESGTLAGMTIRSSTQGAIYFADGLTGNEAYRGRIEYSHTNDSLNFGTAGTGSKLSITSRGDFQFSNGLLSETVNINTTARSGTQAVNLDDGMVHYFSTNSSGTWKPNFTMGSGNDINATIATGDVISPTMIVAKGATTHYANAIQVDGSDVTPEFLGGAPTDGGASGSFDVYSYTIIKTGDDTFKAFASVSNYT